jgi:hypothetical protein
VVWISEKGGSGFERGAETWGEHVGEGRLVCACLCVCDLKFESGNAPGLNPLILSSRFFFDCRYRFYLKLGKKLHVATAKVLK